MLSALWLDYLTCPGCETASEHYETWLVISSLFLLPCLPRVTVKADEKETTWTRSPPNKGERGHWIQTQVVFWCQQNLCQWGETRWMLGRGRSRASRKAGEREEHHLRFCGAPLGAGSWCTWQQDWENKKGYWKSLDLLSFLLSKGGLSPPWDFTLNANCWKPLLCYIT